VINSVCLYIICYSFDSGPGAYRRRRRKTKALEDNLGWPQQNENPYQKFLKRFSQKQHYEREQDSSIISSSNSWIPNSITVTKINQREKSLIDGQRNVTVKQSIEKTVNYSSQSKPCVSVQKIHRRNKTLQLLTLDNMPQENIAQIPSVLQDCTDFLTGPLSALTTTRTNSVKVIKLSRLLHRPTSTMSVKIQPTKNPHGSLNGSGRTRTNQQSASNVSVSKIKRSSSAGRIDRTTTASSNSNLSRLTFIN